MRRWVAVESTLPGLNSLVNSAGMKWFIVCHVCARKKNQNAHLFFKRTFIQNGT
jgi:hypothetical protein